MSKSYRNISSGSKSEEANGFLRAVIGALLGATLLVGPALADEITVGMTAPLSGPQAFFGTT